MTTSTAAVTVFPCQEPAELYRLYEGAFAPQPVYVVFDLRTGELYADYDPEAQPGGTPVEVYNGFVRRYPIPALTGAAANRLLAELRPLATSMLADWERVWDGHNMVARLGPAAEDAEAWIGARLHLDDDDESQGFAEADIVQGVDAGYVVDDSDIDYYGITADTGDARLTEIAADITAKLAGDADPPAAVVVHGLDGHLKLIRDDLAAAAGAR